MTTSRLSTHAHELTESDLQTLFEFALEAPWEWRKALLALIETARRVDKTDDIQADLDFMLSEVDELQTVVDDSTDAISLALATYGAELTLVLGAGSSELRDGFKQLMEDIELRLVNITDAIPDKPVPAAPAQRPVAVAPEADQTASPNDRLKAVLALRKSP